MSPPASINRAQDMDDTPYSPSTMSILQRIGAILLALILLALILLRAFGLPSIWLFALFLTDVIYLIQGPISERLLRFSSDEDEDEDDHEPGPPHAPCPRCPGYIAPSDDTEREPPQQQQPRKQVSLRRKALQRKQRVQQGENWYERSTTPPTRKGKLPRLSAQEVRDLMQRKMRRLDEARRRQQVERDGALVLYVDRSKYIWDFNTTARFMVLNSWFFGVWVSMRCAGLQQDRVKGFMNAVMVLPMTLQTTNTLRRAIAAAVGLASSISGAPVSGATTGPSSAGGEAASGVDASTHNLVRYDPTSIPRSGPSASTDGSSSADGTSNTTNTPPRRGALWLYTSSSHHAALEFFHTLPEVEKAFYTFFLQSHRHYEAEYNGHKEVWESFAEDFPFDNPAFARKYPTWESCVAHLERMPFLREMYGLQVQFAAYMDFKKAEKAFKWSDAALKDTILPEIQRAVKWDVEFEDRRIERESKASRVIFIVDEDPRMFSEYKTKIIETSTPIIELPDSSPTHEDYLATSGDRFPGSLMSSWHMEGDSLDPVLIRAAAAQGVAPPRCTSKATLDRVQEGFENMISEELNVLRGLHWEEILRYHSADPMDEDTETEDSENGEEEEQYSGPTAESQTSGATGENQQAEDDQAPDGVHGEKRERPPVWGDGILMYLDSRKRVRLNSQLPDHPIGKHDRIGYAPITEYSIDIEGSHSLVDLYKDVPGLDHEWDHDIKMPDAPEPEPVHTTMTDAPEPEPEPEPVHTTMTDVIEITSPKQPQSKKRKASEA